MRSHLNYVLGIGFELLSLFQLGELLGIFLLTGDLQFALFLALPTLPVPALLFDLVPVPLDRRSTVALWLLPFRDAYLPWLAATDSSVAR